MDEVGDTMCIVAAGKMYTLVIAVDSLVLVELPNLLPVTVLSKALLRLKKGSYFICRLLGNMPSCFDKGESACYTITIVFFPLTSPMASKLTKASKGSS